MMISPRGRVLDHAFKGLAIFGVHIIKPRVGEKGRVALLIRHLTIIPVYQNRRWRREVPVGQQPGFAIQRVIKNAKC
jgi:hypothetical protein